MRYRVSESGVIEAPPDRVYAVIADYREHHPRIVPPEYFRKIEVLAGGVGAGTRTRIEMRAFGRTRIFEHVISEPEPGRVLVEADPSGASATTFTVEAVPGGTQLTIATEVESRAGVAGYLERFLSAAFLRKVYRKEIVRIGEYLAKRQG